jgi:hypothetical protein
VVRLCSLALCIGHPVLLPALIPSTENVTFYSFATTAHAADGNFSYLRWWGGIFQ